MANFRSITQIGTSEPFELQVSRGQVPGHSPLFKYGYNGNIINVEETIWDVGGTYTYLTSPGTLSVVSASAGDDSGRKITVVGLDSSYNEITHEVTLDENGVGTTALDYFRVYRAYVSGDLSLNGDVTISRFGVTYAQVTAAEQQTLMAIYTVPAGHTLYISQGSATHGTDTSGAYMTVKMLTRAHDGVFRTAAKVDVMGAQFVLPFINPLKIPEKTDIEIRAVCSKNQANSLSATFQGTLVKNEEWE